MVVKILLMNLQMVLLSAARNRNYKSNGIHSEHIIQNLILSFSVTVLENNYPHDSLGLS